MVTTAFTWFVLQFKHSEIQVSISSSVRKGLPLRVSWRLMFTLIAVGILIFQKNAATGLSGLTGDVSMQKMHPTPNLKAIFGATANAHEAS